MRTSYKRGTEVEKEVPKDEVKVVEVETTAKVEKKPVNDFSSDFIYNPEPVSEGQSDSEQEAVSRMIVSGYSQIKRSVPNEDSGMQSSDFGSTDTAVETKKKDKRSKKKDKTKKKSKRGLWIGIVIFILVASAVGVLLYKGVIPFGTPEPTEPPTEPYELQYDIIEEGINSLYWDEEKSGIADGFTQDDVDVFYDKLEDAENHGEDISDLEEELDTISQYLKDSKEMSALESEDCDLSPDTLMTDVLKLKISADSYSVEGLKNSIYSRADSLLALRQEYMRMKSELLNITDLLSFDKGDYEENISIISHTKNFEELSILLAKVSAESDFAKAELALSEMEEGEEKELAKEALEATKCARDEAIKAWLMYIGEYVEEPTEVPTEETTGLED